MKRALLLLALLLCASGAFAATTATVTTPGAGATVVGTTITTALAYVNPALACVANTVCYVGSTITITGSLCTGGAPCTWTLKDQNSDTVQTVSTTGAKGATTPLGSVDCTGSAANTACVYNAPVEYPSTQTITVGITDGSTSATVTVNFVYLDQLNEYWTHLGRTRLIGTTNGINNIPLSIYSLGGNPITYSPLQVNFIDTYLQPNIEAAILSITSDADGASAGAGVQLPVTSGSSINRPAFSFDGHWINFNTNQQIPSFFSNTYGYVQHTDGSAMQRLGSTCFPILSGGQVMWEKNQPNWLLTVDGTKLYVCDLGNSQTTTAIATHGITNPQPFSYENGLTDNLYPLRSRNAGSCSPILTSCAVTVTTFDISPCYVSLTSTCATSSGTTFNSFFNLSTGFDSTGVRHCNDGVTGDSGTNGDNHCEWRFHDIYFIPRSIKLVWNYGPFSNPGESLFYQGDVNGDVTTVTPIFPNFSGSNNVAYMSHPSFNHSSPSLISYGGLNGCAPVVSNVCTNASTGSVVWDFRSNSSVFFDSVAGVGHTCWDGFYIGYFCQDSSQGSAGDIVNGCYSHTLSEMNLNVGAGSRRVFQNFGCRPQDTNGAANSYLLSPSQSPDATKVAYSTPPSQQLQAKFINIGWMFFSHKPAPPVNVTLSGSVSALIQWTPSPLSYETHLYWVYKQPSCSGAWTRLTSVTGVFRQFSNYTVADGALGAGSNACYAVTTQEWSGQESDHLSNIVKITNAAGVFSKTQMSGEGTTNFAPAGPSDVTGLAVAQNLLCATNCAGVSTPTAPAMSVSGTGITGNLMWGGVVYCKFLDFPANTNPICTPLSINTTGLNLSNQGVLFQSSTAEMVGQDAVQFYMSGPNATQPAASTFHLQTPSSCTTTGTVAAATILLNNNQNSSGSRVSCVVTSFNGASAAPPVTNAAIGGYLLTWTDPGGAGDRYEQIYYRENAAVDLSHGELNAQQYLIATIPIGQQKFYDAFPNQATAAANVHYAVAVKRMDGTRSTGVCLKGDGTADTCL